MIGVSIYRLNIDVFESERVLEVVKELIKFPILTHYISQLPTDWHSERRESALELSKRMNQKSI
jgi:arsenic resistance protein ArsH